MKLQQLILTLSFVCLPLYSIAQLETKMPWETGTENKNSDYQFSTTWRLEIGFQQPNQRSDSTTNNTFFNGGKVGFLVDFNLPYHLGIQTGLRYELTYGTNKQHYRSADNSHVTVEYIRHDMLKHALSIPIRLVYTQQLWRELALTAYTGPTFQIGLAYTDKPFNALSDTTLNWIIHNSPDKSLFHIENHDYYSDKQFYRFNLQWGLGAGLQWRHFRLEGGYNFGLNNLAHYQPNTGAKTNMHEWSWEVSFIYTINYQHFDPNYAQSAQMRREARQQARENKKANQKPIEWHFGTGF